MAWLIVRLGRRYSCGDRRYSLTRTEWGDDRVDSILIVSDSEAKRHINVFSLLSASGNYQAYEELINKPVNCVGEDVSKGANSLYSLRFASFELYQ